PPCCFLPDVAAIVGATGPAGAPSAARLAANPAASLAARLAARRALLRRCAVRVARKGGPEPPRRVEWACIESASASPLSLLCWPRPQTYRLRGCATITARWTNAERQSCGR